MASIDFHSYRHSSPSNSSRWTSWLAALSNRLKLWQALMRERRHLRSLDDHTLKDIGLSRMHAEYEADRPFWDTARMNGRHIHS